MIIDELTIWLDKNKLVPNTKKTKLMIFTPRKLIDIPDVYFNNSKLEWVDEFKYLGFVLDNNLSCISHVKYVLNRLSTLYGAIYSISNYMPRKTLISVYYSLIYSVICQDIVIWGGVAPSNLLNINIIINKIFRCIM